MKVGLNTSCLVNGQAVEVTVFVEVPDRQIEKEIARLLTERGQEVITISQIIINS